MTSSDPIYAIDIGCSKVAACVARPNDSDGFDDIDIETVYSSRGLLNGTVSDVKAVRTAIEQVIGKLEERQKGRCGPFVVNISNPALKNHIFKIKTQVHGQQIKASHIQKAVSQAIAHVRSDESTCLSAEALVHQVDNATEIVDPEFMFATEIISLINAITIPSIQLTNLKICTEVRDLKVTEFVPTGRASGIACSTKNERERGCVVIDLGAGTSNYAAFRHNGIFACGSVGEGGSAVTDQISRHFSLDLAQSERLKVLHGSLRTVSLDGSAHTESGEEIPLPALNKAIKAKFGENLARVLGVIRAAQVPPQCLDNVIFCGGGSQFFGLTQFVHHEFLLNCKTAEPSIVGPEHCALMGLALYASKGQTRRSSGTNGLKKAIAWLKENL